MSSEQQSSALVWIGACTGLITIFGVFVMIGSLKGELVTTIAEHSRRIEHHDQKIDNLGTDVADLKARVHGVASQLGKLPGNVAARIQENKQ